MSSYFEISCSVIRDQLEFMVFLLSGNCERAEELLRRMLEEEVGLEVEVGQSLRQLMCDLVKRRIFILITWSNS